MASAIKLMIPTFVNEIEEDFFEIEIENNAIYVPNYLLTKNFEEKISSMLDECDSILSEDTRDPLDKNVEIDLEGLINENCWKCNETGISSSTASFRTGCVAHSLQLVLKDGFSSVEVC